MVATIILIATSMFFAYCYLTRYQVEEEYYELFLKEVNKNGDI